MMNLHCQSLAIENIRRLAEHQQHGVIISGGIGNGKSYLAKQYARLLGISDFCTVNPTVAEIKAIVDTKLTDSSPLVLCIENLDSGVTQAAYPLLKLLEDCPEYLYIVVTCRNLCAIPDTIISRCAIVSILPPNPSDIEQYASNKNSKLYLNRRDLPIWKSIKGLADVDAILDLTPEQLKYISELPMLLDRHDTVSSLSWKLSHYPEGNTDTPILLVMQYIFTTLSGYNQRACLGCMQDLVEGRLSKNAILSKFIFELMYTN